MNTAYIGTPVKYIYVMCYLTTFLRCDIPVSICIQQQCRYNVDHRDTMIIKSYCDQVVMATSPVMFLYISSQIDPSKQ